MTLITSSISPIFNSSSSSVFAVMDGLNLNHCLPSIDLQQPGLAIHVEQKVKAIEFEGMVALNYKFLNSLHRLDDHPLNIRESTVSGSNSHSTLDYGILGKHEVLQVVEKPFPSDSLHVRRRIHVDCHVREMFVFVNQCLHKLSRS